MLRRISFLILIALGLVAVPGTFMISGALILGIGLAGVWVIHPVVLPILVSLVPYYFAVAVVVGAILVLNGRSRTAAAVLCVPALIGLLTLIVWLR